ncbi:MAG: ankyrin repeat domain-containing protein [Pontixanthobacter sp.]
MATSIFGPISGVILRAIGSAIVLCAAAASVPGHGQYQSEGYKFLEAVSDRDGNIATAFLSEPGSVVVNTRDVTTGETALHIVARRRDVVWINFLAQNGANPNIRARNGETPLQIAAVVGPVESVEALIRAGANIDDSNVAGETPLIGAVHRRDVPLVRLLLDKGANPDRNDNSGRSARDYVALQSANTLLQAELAKADETKAGRAETKAYGPTF